MMDVDYYVIVENFMTLTLKDNTKVVMFWADEKWPNKTGLTCNSSSAYLTIDSDAYNEKTTNYRIDDNPIRFKKLICDLNKDELINFMENYIKVS